MKKILYLHGFASSGASGTVDLLRREFWEREAEDKRATIVAPDIPLDPLVALPMLKALAAREAPDLIVGTSMGGFYAQLLHGFVRICVNPSFWLSKKIDESKIDWSGFGDVVMKRYYARLKKEGLPQEDEVDSIAEGFEDFLCK